MASERTPLLEDSASAEAPGHSLNGPSPTYGSPDPEAQPHAPDIPIKETSTQDLLTIIPLLLLGVFICNGDTSLVLATNGTIASDFRDLDRSSWLLTSFMLSMCAVQPLYGKLSDVCGRKETLIAAYMLFTIGCIISGVGSTLNEVIIGRVISGAGGAGMTALVSIIIADMVPPRDVASWRSYVNVAATTGRSLGGPIGGYLTDTVGWRWSFYGQCPPLLLALVLIIWRLPSSASHKSAESDYYKSQLSAKGSKLAQIDFLGATLLAGAIICLLLIMDLTTKKTHVATTTLLAGLALFLGGSFVLVEKRFARHPIFPLFLFAKRDIVTSYLTVLLQIAGQSSIMFIIPIYFQITENSTVADAGSRLMPAVVGNAIGGLLSGFLIHRTGKYKLLSILGPAGSAVGFLLILLFWNGSTNLVELMYSVPGGFGTGIVQSTTFVQLSAGIDPSLMAIAGSSLYLSQNLGAVIGLSLPATVLQSTLRSRLSQSLRQYSNSTEIIERSVSNLHFVQSLEGRVRELVVDGYLTSMNATYVVAIVCSLLAVTTALFMREHQL